MKLLELVFQNFWSSMWAFLIVFILMFYLTQIVRILVNKQTKKLRSNIDEEEVLGIRPGYQTSLEKSVQHKVKDMNALVEKANAQAFLGIEFINLVQELRTAQKNYNLTKEEYTLLRCKELERKIDKKLNSLTSDTKKNISDLTGE